MEDLNKINVGLSLNLNEDEEDGDGDGDDEQGKLKEGPTNLLTISFINKFTWQQ